MNNCAIQIGLIHYTRIHMDQERLVRISEVQRRVGLGRSTIWLWIKQGRFPQGIKLSPSVTVWYESEITAFIAGNWNVK